MECNVHTQVLLYYKLCMFYIFNNLIKRLLFVGSTNWDNWRLPCYRLLLALSLLYWEGPITTFTITIMCLDSQIGQNLMLCFPAKFHSFPDLSASHAKQMTPVVKYKPLTFHDFKTWEKIDLCKVIIDTILKTLSWLKIYFLLFGQIWIKKNYSN